jgi:hypothetical protein
MSASHDEHGHGGGHSDHGHGEGGHEIDRMPNARLFNLLFGLSGLTLLAGIGVVQLFNLQVEAIETQRAEAGSFRRNDYEAEMAAIRTGSGTVKVSELDDAGSISTRSYMPIAAAKKAVLDDPNRLKGFGMYRGWKTADEQAPAAAAPAGPPGAMPVPKPTPDPAAPGAAPGGAAPGGAAPGGAAPGGAAPGGAAPGGAAPGGAAPGGAAPGGAAPGGAAPGGAAPTGDAPPAAPPGRDGAGDAPKPDAPKPDTKAPNP